LNSLIHHKHLERLFPFIDQINDITILHRGHPVGNNNQGFTTLFSASRTADSVIPSRELVASSSTKTSGS